MAQCHTKKKTITLRCWTESNDDWTLVTSQDPKRIKKINYYAVPTWIVRPANGDPERIGVLMRKYAKTFPEWARHAFSVVTQKYWDHYKAGSYYQFAWLDPEKTPGDSWEEVLEPWAEAVKLLEAKDYEHFVVNGVSGNGFLYDEKKRPVPRMCHIEYIEMHGRLRYYNPKKLTPEQVFALLEKHPQALNVKWEEIPYCNQDDDGITRVPIFDFNPKSNRQFWNMYKAARDRSHDFKSLTFTRLKILGDTAVSIH